MTADAEALAEDYVAGLGATVLDRSVLGPDLGTLLGVSPTDGRAVGLAFGDQVVELIEFTHARGRDYPDHRVVHDLAFQHFALTVTDIHGVHARLSRSGRFTPISHDGPVRLPQASGGAIAFKFRDAEGHPLELLQLPSTTTASGVPPGGATTGGAGVPRVSGVDHTAIAVSDTARTSDFFARLLGFTKVGSSHNRGAEQARLDGLASAEVAVTSLRGGSLGPGVELLRYDSPRPLRSEVAANDIAATHTVFSCASLTGVLDALDGSRPGRHARAVAAGRNGMRVVSVRDPDGHRLIIEETG